MAKGRRSQHRAQRIEQRFDAVQGEARQQDRARGQALRLRAEQVQVRLDQRAASVSEGGVEQCRGWVSYKL
jgi:hypothetical protein